MRRLIFAWNYLEWGGAQVYLIAIMKLAMADFDVVVILPRASRPDILRYLDDIGVRYEFIDSHLDLGAAPTVARKIVRQYRRVITELETLRYLRRYDLPQSILHIDTSPWQSWFFLPRLAMRGANIFVTFHNSLPAAPAWREMIWKARMQIASRLRGFHIFASNKDTKESLRGWVEDEFWKGIRVTYTCVNPPEIEQALASASPRAVLREEFGINDDDLVVLCVGQFIDRKGRWVFLEAARTIAGSNPDVQFLWLTPKMPSDDDLAKIEGYGLGDRFKLVLSETVGQKRLDILTFYRIADVFTLASFVEGLPIALLEAMAMGLPSISTNVNAIPEAIFDHKTGILIEPDNAPQLADAILELKHDAELRAKLSAAGLEFVLANFDERVASRIAIEAYKECFADAD